MGMYDKRIWDLEHEIWWAEEKSRGWRYTKGVGERWRMVDVYVYTLYIVCIYHQFQRTT